MKDDLEMDWEDFGGKGELDETDVDPMEYERSENLTDKIWHTVKDVGKQVAKEGAVGALGTYGSILDVLGQKRSLPGSEARHESMVEKQQSNEPYSIMDMLNMTGFGEGEDLVPEQSRLPESSDPIHLPTQENLRDLNDYLGGPGEGDTALGRGAGRIANIYTSSVMTGGGAGGSLLPSILGGGAGQITEEMGGGENAQLVAELLGMFGAHGVSKAARAAMSPSHAAKHAALEPLGLTNKDILLAEKAAQNSGKKIKGANKSGKTETAFENADISSSRAAENTIRLAAPDWDKGSKSITKAASDRFTDIGTKHNGLVFSNPKEFIDGADEVINQLKNTLGKNPKAQPMIDRLQDAKKAALQNAPAEYYTEFYKELNQMGDWADPSTQEHLIRKLKNSIKKTAKSQGPAGREFAADFEQANASYTRAKKLESARDFLDKHNTSDGWNWKTLKNDLEKPVNRELLTDAFGKTSADNMFYIAKTGKEIGDFNKAWTSTSKWTIPEMIGAGTDTAGAGGVIYYALKGEYDNAAEIMAALALKRGTQFAKGRFKEKMLTDPNYQRPIIRGLNALKNGSSALLTRASQELFDRMHMDEFDVEEFA